MPTPLKVYTHMALAESERDLKLRAPGHVTVACARECADPGEQLARFLEADVVFGNPPPQWMGQSHRLQWLQLESVGTEAYEPLAHEDWTARIRVTNLRGFFGAPVAETLLAGVLALCRGLMPLRDAQARRQWSREQVRPALRLIAGSRAILLGTGSIALHLEKALAGLGVATVFFGRTSPRATLRTMAELDRALPEADLVFGCLPHSEQTQGLISRERLARFRPTAILANGGRGSLIDEDALVDALDRNAIYGAVLDVTREEPLPENHGLWRHPRVVLTHHTGGGFQEEVPAKTDFFLANLERFERGEELVNPVNLAVRVASSG